VLILLEGRLAPKKRRREYERAHALVVRGPYARRFWGLAVMAGTLAPLLLLLLLPLPASAVTTSLVGALILVGLWVGEDVLVRAGQALSIS
jgi:hypothetical protein